MEISGEYTFDAPQELVWEALQDPDVLSNAMPGGEGFTEVAENEFTGNLKIRVGPVQGKFKGNIKLVDVVAPESYKMEVDGKGAPGFVKATGGIQLTGQGEKTHLAYEGQAKVGGRIASVGQRLMDTSAKSIIRQSLEGLNEYLKVQVAQQAVTEAVAGVEQAEEMAETAVPAYKPPSQTQVAANVAKDIATEYWPYIIGLVIVLVIVLILLLL